ncbi:MAG: DUF2953 domain-containing protein [ANME-2 cluster archaeon]|nr:DUF2953 domain-containing protein [ANME-2 cluster archaeon]
MLWVTITGIMMIAAVAFTLLLFPVTINANSNKYGTAVEGIFSVSWLILKVRYSLNDKRTDILFFNRKMRTLNHIEQTRKDNTITESTRLEKSRKSPPIKSIANLAGPLLRLFRNLIHIPRFRYLDIDITYGLDDPALSGILTGLLYSVHSAFGMGHNFRFTPDFTRPLLDWSLIVCATIMPIKIVPPMIRFTTNKDVLRFGWGMMRR